MLARRKTGLSPEQELAAAHKILSCLKPSREDYQWAWKVIIRREAEEDLRQAQAGIWPKSWG